MSSLHRFDKRVAPAVAKAVAKAAMETGVARITVDPEEVAEKQENLRLLVNNFNSFQKWQRVGGDRRAVLKLN
ncbi:malic protein NAD-binding protein [Bacillus subtilis]|nr:malic protein NAD-binding protein [Bacillus subtilis]